MEAAARSYLFVQWRVCWISGSKQDFELLIQAHADGRVGGLSQQRRWQTLVQPTHTLLTNNGHAASNHASVCGGEASG